MINPDNCQLLPYSRTGSKQLTHVFDHACLPILPKAWCDVQTDGGGFMLVAKKDDPVTWTVPSSKDPVGPHDKPHWSSIFGKVEMLDIRFQVSTTLHFKDTKAHW